MALRSKYAVGKSAGNKPDGSGPYTTGSRHALKAATKREPPGQRPAHQITPAMLDHWDKHAGNHAAYAPKDRLAGVRSGGDGLSRPISKAPIKRY